MIYLMIMMMRSRSGLTGDSGGTDCEAGVGCEEGCRTSGVAEVLVQVESGSARAHAESTIHISAEGTLGETGSVVGELVGRTSR
jgi:hypothetical protein